MIPPRRTSYIVRLYTYFTDESPHTTLHTKSHILQSRVHRLMHRERRCHTFDYVLHPRFCSGPRVISLPRTSMTLIDTKTCYTNVYLDTAEGIDGGSTPR